MIRCALTASLSLLVPAVAFAQSALVLVPEAELDADVRERARSAAIETLAERGVRLVRTPEGQACAEPACAAALATQAGADFVLLVRFEAQEDGGSRVRAIVVPTEGDAREGLADVGPASGTAAATRAALEGALAGMRDRRLGFLMVRTDPPGARVMIDGEPAGQSPLRRMLAPGVHRVRIVPESGEPREHRIEVRPLEETALEADFEEEREGAAPAPPSTASEPSPLNWLLGGGLAIGGVVALVSPLQTLATEGECVDLIENVGCVERVAFGPVSGVLLGVGIAALVAAVVVDVVAPIRLDVQVGAEAGMLLLEGRF